MSQLSDKVAGMMDAALYEVYLEEELPGITAVVVQHQETIWSKSYGHADLDTKREADLDTLFHLGSVTKIFTAVMLMQLRDAGKLQLDDPLDKYLPAIKEEIGHPTITLKQLASHTSGLPMMPPLPELAQAMQEFPPSMETLRNMTFPSIERIIEVLPQAEWMFAPGEQVAYSNLGIALLAHALERVADRAYTDFVAQEILHPLSMENSGFSATVRNAKNTATCYLPFYSPPQVAPFETKMIAGFTPTGALWSSANDMARFLAYLTSPDASFILSRNSLSEMCQMIAPLESPRYIEGATGAGVGIGWFLAQIQEHLLAEHGGADPSTAAYLAWIPQLELTVFIATNTGKNPTAVAVTASKLLQTIIQN